VEISSLFPYFYATSVAFLFAFFSFSFFFFFFLSTEMLLNSSTRFGYTGS